MINGQMVNDSSLSDDWAPVRLTPKYWLIFRIFKIFLGQLIRTSEEVPPPLLVFALCETCFLHFGEPTE